MDTQYETVDTKYPVAEFCRNDTDSTDNQLHKIQPKIFDDVSHFFVVTFTI